MATTSNFFLYSLTIQPPSHITQAILGQFSGQKLQEIIVASGSRLSLLQPDPQQGKVNNVLSHDLFGIIRCLAAFRLAGSSKGMSYSFVLCSSTRPKTFFVFQKLKSDASSNSRLQDEGNSHSESEKNETLRWYYRYWSLLFILNCMLF